MAIATGNHPAALWPGIHKWFGMEYSKHDPCYSKIFDVRKSSQAYEKTVRSHGFGLAPAKSEGSAVTYATQSQKDTTTFTHVAYALGYIVTREEMDDNLYMQVSKSRARALAFSMRTTKEIVAANTLNNGFDSNYTGGDGVELFAQTHPSSAGTYQNELTVAADFSEAALEDMLILISNAVDYNGLEIKIRGQKLVIPNELQFDAQRILEADLQAGTANNDLNAVKSMGMLPGGVVVNPYLTDTDAWFVTTDVPEGLTMFQRKSYEFGRDNDFDTDNAKAKAYERYSVGWSDPLGVFGSEGA